MTHSNGNAYKPLAAKSSCAREWGGWGRISEDGSGQNNPNRNEDPWGRAGRPLERRCSHAPRPRLRTRSKTRPARSTKEGGKPHDAKTSLSAGRPRLTFRP